MILPFSALRASPIGARFAEITLVQSQRSFTWTDTEGKEHHQLGDALIAHNGIHYLSTVDFTQKHFTYALIQLPRTAEDVPDAMVSLMPETIAIRTAIQPYGIDRQDGNVWDRGVYLNGVRRQGDWWFYPDKPASSAERLTNTYLPQATGRRRSHYATELRTQDDQLWVRGTVRHGANEHYMVRLGKVWHRAVPNTATNAWSAIGGVD